MKTNPLERKRLCTAVQSENASTCVPSEDVLNKKPKITTKIKYENLTQMPSDENEQHILSKTQMKNVFKM